MASKPVPDMENKIQQALDYILDGDSTTDACLKAGIARSTFVKHVDAGEYARAREVGADVWFDLIRKTRDRVDSGDLEPNAGRVVSDIDKWSLSKILPRKFGDKVGVELTGKDGGPVQHLDMSQMTDDQLQAILAEGGK